MKDAEIWQSKDDDGLTLIGFIAFFDPPRPGVLESVQACQSKGITVRIVTCDNIKTTKNIAIKCGIISEAEAEDDEVCMHGADFVDMVAGHIKYGEPMVPNMEIFAKIAPKIKVIARTSCGAKELLVAGLKEMGKSVAVTGDYEDDAEALAKADVGFALSYSDEISK